MKIVIVNQYAGGPTLGMENRPYMLAKIWRELGHTVTIVTASFSHLRRRNLGDCPSGEAMEILGVRYVVLPTLTYDGNGVRRGLSILQFSSEVVLAARRLRRSLRPDIVIASSTHALDVFGAKLLAGRCGKLIFEVHDLWPLTPVELDGLSPRHPFTRLLQFGENWAYRKADRVISMLPHAKSYMVEHGMRPEKYLHIPSGVDPDVWAEPDLSALPEEHERVLTLLRRRVPFLVGYTGGFALSNDLESFLAAVELTDIDIHAVLIGDGECKAGLVKQYRSSSRISFLPPVTHSAIPAVLKYFDACFVGYRRSSLYRFGVNPNKVFDYMMAERAIICAVEAPEDPVTLSGGGITVSPEDPDAIRRALEELAKEGPAAREARGRAGRVYVEKRHNYRVLAAEFLSG
jgi:glycosyltransferase involved in cell wall biosynthesis